MKLVRGVGINDYSGMVTFYDEFGNRRNKPFYEAWTGMLMRCYSEKYHIKKPTYSDCSVCSEWLSLSNFKEWHDSNYVKGWVLDKDLVTVGNKVYSSRHCRYVPTELNGILNDCKATRGKYPQGVYFNKVNGKFLVQIRINSKRVSLCLFTDPHEAGKAYASAKSGEMLRLCDLYEGDVDNLVISSLRSVASSLVR